LCSRIWGIKASFAQKRGTPRPLGFVPCKTVVTYFVSWNEMERWNESGSGPQLLASPFFGPSRSRRWKDDHAKPRLGIVAGGAEVARGLAEHGPNLSGCPIGMLRPGQCGQARDLRCRGRGTGERPVSPEGRERDHGDEVRLGLRRVRPARAVG